MDGALVLFLVGPVALLAKAGGVVSDPLLTLAGRVFGGLAVRQGLAALGVAALLTVRLGSLLLLAHFGALLLSDQLVLRLLLLL